METKSQKHQNYEILNLIGYGLAKFNDDFIREFGFTSKTAFYKYCIDIDIAKTVGTVKNRMDLFDPFFPNKRKGWWERGDAYIHRKELIDSLFGHEDVKGYVDIVKLYFQKNFQVDSNNVEVKPIIQSKFRKLQETGLDAELFFIHNFEKEIPLFRNGILEDARLYGDGYDFQINVDDKAYLAEVKGIREKKGKFRLTEKEYEMAVKYKHDYVLSIILNMNDVPIILAIENPVRQLQFEERIIDKKQVKEYHLVKDIC